MNEVLRMSLEISPQRRFSAERKT